MRKYTVIYTYGAGTATVTVSAERFEVSESLVMFRDRDGRLVKAFSVHNLVSIESEGGGR